MVEIAARRGCGMNRVRAILLILVISAGCVLSVSPAIARVEPSGEPTSPKAAPPTTSLYHKGQWDISLESAYLFKVVNNPLTAIGGDYTKNKIPYRLATQILAARYQLTEPAGPFFLRGSLEISGNFIYSAIIEGPEPFFVGLAVGLRYNFVQPESRIVPYLEFRGGPGYTDARARGKEYAQQEDFTFTYMMGAGLRYDLSQRVSISAGMADQHISNFYVTRPNYGFDAIGIHLGLNIRY